MSQWGLLAGGGAADRPLADPPATFSLGSWGRYDGGAEGWGHYASPARCHHLLDSWRGCRSRAPDPYFSAAGGAWALERVAGTSDQFRLVAQVGGPRC